MYVKSPPGECINAQRVCFKGGRGAKDFVKNGVQSGYIDEVFVASLNEPCC
ncbi:hypothetical protein M407DRAFT_34342 [Tulasnella calospora MUT 4182]|uniref:Uncharacterized protein n=1 Tax=Tulasnella calospora MUT 4182 TaxID=1051891 RepID=A0A0C3Q0T7_9AGAM|nr:hypothetical protein M407DRAFT_34342 [Tulasnella calospora MUT 4182]